MINQIFNLLGQDKISDAINLLKKIIRDNEDLKILVIQSARYTDIVKKIHLGVVEDTIANIEKNKIRVALTNLAIEIDEQLKDNPNLIKKKYSSSDKQVHYGKGDNIAGDKISNIVFFDANENKKKEINDLTIIGLHSNEEKEISTLDDIKIKWIYTGANEKIKIKLTQLNSGKETVFFERMLHDSCLVIPNGAVAKLYEDADLYKVYPIRVTIQLKNRSYQFGPFDIMTGLNIHYYFNEEDYNLEIFTQTMNNGLLQHSAELKLVCHSKKTLDIQSFDINVIKGKAKQQIPKAFNPNLSTIKFIYLGHYPICYVRYNDWNK